MEEVRITTYNAYGDFCFYVTEELLREFLDGHQMIISIEFFKNFYTPQQSRALYDWLKKRNKDKKGPAST
ncbi:MULTISPECIES: hypothetical protein [Paenibacillus]|jgi:hypothetical protein|uniref:hypothetical protein n=1 Tax=Paenibacillus TaxID=44249 RepID=UPI00240DDF44|nr:MULTISPECIES: hypothetical protein [Paenibacillus]MCI1776594.1 hypothetical protein [Paenibacillus lautus]WFB57577.1 hypothetical protein P0X86_27020 [Paenibacillus sp. BR1-192]